VYRAAIIGLGFIGAGDQVSGDRIGQQVAAMDGTHAAALSGHPRVRLVAGSSRDPGRRARFAQRSRARVYADWQELLDRERPDLVSVATNPEAHADIVAECAARGARVVYCEKPIATRIADAERMVAACARRGVLLVINHNRRFNPNYHRLQRAVASGDLGELTSAALRWGSGRLGNVGTHMVDAVCMLAGRRVRAVSGTLDRAARPDCRGPEFHDPGGWGVLRLDGDLMVTLDAADYGAGPLRLVLYGTKGQATTGGDEVALEYLDGRRDRWPSRRAEATSMNRAVTEIVAWLDEGRPPEQFAYQPMEALAVLEAIVALHASDARDAAWVALPLTGPDREREVHSG
jgi:predicted dehydrogenase